MNETTQAGGNAVEIRMGLPEGCRDEAARLFFEAFHHQLRGIMPTEEIALRLLPNDLNANRVIVAIESGKMVGFAGLAYEGSNYMTFSMRDFRERFGPIGGFFRYLVYAAAGRPVSGRELVVDGLGVTESMRRRGIGSMLLDAVCRFASERGFHYVRLDVVDTNEPARRLYEQFGFTIVRTRRNPVFLDPDARTQCDIEMRKDLRIPAYPNARPY
jgi:ribosomal protein S18 acetylase RimI-like enzyme